MGKACCLSLGFVINCFSLILLILAVSSNYWYIVEEKFVKNIEVNTTIPNKPFLYPSNLGLWMTCYDKSIPDTVSTKNLVSENCFWNYDFLSKQLEDFARTSVTSLSLACGIIVISGMLVAAGGLCEKSVLIRIGGILLLLSCLVTFVGICCFIGRIFLEGKTETTSQNQNKHVYFGWAFYIGWISLLFQGLAGVILARTASKFEQISSKVNKNFA